MCVGDTKDSVSVIYYHHDNINVCYYFPTNNSRATLTMNSSRLLISRQSHRLLSRSRIAARPISSSSSSSSSSAASAQPTAATAILVSIASALVYANSNDADAPKDVPSLSTLCSAAARLGAEPTMLSPATEPKTGILFPRLCNGMTFVGCGVRVKYGFVKVRYCSVQNVYIIQ